MHVASALGIAALAVALLLVVLRTGSLHRRGIEVPGRVIVRCGRGHLFTTLWVPLASLKAVRLGSMRIQFCPVGHHVSAVRPVPESDLTAEELKAARSHSDGPIP